MGSPCPPNSRFAARAAYFGERMCAFCDHRNPVGAKFCNDCASPLHLKPCKQCDAVNDQAATDCYKCGAAWPVSSETSRSTPVLASPDSMPAWSAPGDVVVPATTTQPLFVDAPSHTGWLVPKPGRFLLAAIATLLIMGAHDAYRPNVATRDAKAVVSEPIGPPENNVTAPEPAVPLAVEWKPAAPESSIEAPAPTMNAEASKRSSVHQSAARVPGTRHASAPRRPVPRRPAPVEKIPAVGTHGLAAARVGARVAQTSKASPPDQWQVMHVSLARCGGDLIARIVCDQRVRRHFCEGHWGEAPQCASGVANEHGQ